MGDRHDPAVDMIALGEIAHGTSQREPQLVAIGFGGRVEPEGDIASKAIGREQLNEAHRTGCHGAIRDHLAARVIAMWRLWLRDQADGDAIECATTEWLGERDAKVRA